MKERVNPNIYVTVIIGLTAYVFLSIIRLLPFDMTHVMYVCQRYMAQMPQVIIYLVGLSLALVLISFITTIWRTKKFRDTLVPTIHPKKVEEMITKYAITESIVVIHSNIPNAFCLGLLNPTIYISDSIVRRLTKKELFAVLLHEIHHTNKKHYLLRVIIGVCGKCLFFFPSIADIIKRFEILIEIDADRAAGEILGESKYTLSAFKKLLLHSNAPYGLSFDSKSTMQYRIQALMDKPLNMPRLSKGKLYFSMTIFLLLSSLYLIPATKTEVHAGKQDIMLFCLRDRTCLSQCTSETRASYL